MNRQLHFGASVFFSTIALFSLCVFVWTAIREFTLWPPAPIVAPGVQRLPSALESSHLWGIAFLLSSALALFWLRRTWRLYASARRSPSAAPIA